MGVSQDGAVRPYVPPSAAGAGAMCLASAVMLHSGWLARESTSWVSWVAVASCVALGGAALGCSLLLHRFRIGLRWFAGGLAVGCLACTAWLNGWHSCKRAIEERPVSSWWLVVASEPAMGPYGYSVTLELRETPDSPALARVRATTRQPLDLGACMRAVGRFEELDDSDWARSRFMKGEVASMRIVSVLEREQLRTSCIESVKSLVVHAICPERDDARALLVATICGRTTELATSEAYESFRACGLTHLVAVSGGHLAYIAALMEAGLQHLRLGCVRQRVILLIVLSAYVMFTGASPSAVRSVSMVGAASLAVLGRRRAHGLSGLAVAVMILVAANPGVVFDVGFQLSAVSVLFMLVFARYGAGALESAHVPARIAEPLSLTLVAQWATLPITMPLFGEVSLVAPLANLIVGPVMTALLVTGLAGSGLAALASGAAVALPLAEGVCASLSDALLGAPVACAHASIFLAQALSEIPYGLIAVAPSWWMPCAMYAGAWALYIKWPRLRSKTLLRAACVTGCCIAVALMRWCLFAKPSVTVLDVGQGDAILIREGSHALLVDAGVDEATRVALARNHVFHLDAVIVTHWDADHWGGLPEVLKTVPVERIYVAHGAARAAPDEVRASGVPLDELRRGDMVRVGGFDCSVVWPAGVVSGEENEESLVLAVSYAKGASSLDVLLTGDTERDELEQYAGAVGDVDAIKMGHHGSRVSVSADALSVLKPEIAVASAGEGNAYGHPAPESIAVATDAGARFVCTIDDGDIELAPGVEGAIMRTSR